LTARSMKSIGGREQLRDREERITIMVMIVGKGEGTMKMMSLMKKREREMSMMMRKIKDQIKKEENTTMKMRPGMKKEKGSTTLMDLAQTRRNQNPLRNKLKGEGFREEPGLHLKKLL
jgi:hypothetical protein